MDASRRRGLLLATLAPLALTACGGGPDSPDRVAAPLPGAFEALGIRGLVWGKAVVDGDSIVLLDARGELEGAGPVHASEISVTSFAPSDTGWTATSVRADIVDGSITARRILIVRPLARRLGNAWSVLDAGRSVDGYEGPALGVRVAALRAAVEPVPPQGARPLSSRFSAHGLSLRAAGLPPSLAPLAGIDWDVSVRATMGTPGRATYEVERAEAKGWSLRGQVDLAGPPGFAATLPALGGPALADPARWPAGVLLREAGLDAFLQAPSVLVGGNASDPVARAMATAASAGRPVTWHVAVSPPRPVPVRELPDIFRAPGADAVLGLSASGPDLPGQAPPGREPSTADAAPARTGPSGR